MDEPDRGCAGPVGGGGCWPGAAAGGREGGPGRWVTASPKALPAPWGGGWGGGGGKSARRLSFCSAFFFFFFSRRFFRLKKEGRVYKLNLGCPRALCVGVEEPTLLPSRGGGGGFPLVPRAEPDPLPGGVRGGLAAWAPLSSPLSSSSSSSAEQRRRRLPPRGC